MDVRVTKNIRIFERLSTEFQFVAHNVFNHPVFLNPGLSPSANSVSDFGVVSSQGNDPRQLQFGLRVTF
jgi:hypothetical protein